MLHEQESKNKFISINLLRRRSTIIQKIRQFFLKRKFWEVDCPIACKQRIFEPNIDLIPVTINGESGWLHSSPETGMKQLIAAGSGDIFQISHVFRNNEQGSQHSVEFSMLEWYSIHLSLDATIQFTLDLLQEILGPIPIVITTYEMLFKEHMEIDPHSVSCSTLAEKISTCKNLYPYEGLIDQSRDEMLNFLMSSIIEPSFPKDKIIVIKNFPATQTLMGKWKNKEGVMIGQRFEVYKGPLELANGALEETNPQIQYERLEEARTRHLQKNQKSSILDKAFLSSLKKGLPECCGVAIGIERLCMLVCNSSCIEELLPLHWR